MLLEKQLQAFSDDVGVGGGDGDAAGVRRAQTVDEAIALRRRGPARELRDLLDEILVEFRALVECQRRSEHRDHSRPGFREPFGRREHAWDGFVVPFERHPAGEADAVAEELDAGGIQTLRVGRNGVVERREDQAERGFAGLSRAKRRGLSRAQSRGRQRRQDRARACGCGDSGLQKRAA